MKSFLSGSLIMLVGSNLANFLNYLYHPLMARLLGPAGYGELAVLISMLGLVLMVPTSLGLVITKFVASSGETAQQQLIRSLNKVALTWGMVPFLLICLSSIWLANFLHLSSPLAVIVVGVIFYLYLSLMVVRSSLQGMLKFMPLVGSLIAENALKIFLGAGLVILGWGVSGGLVGFAIGTLSVWLLFRNLVIKKVKAGQVAIDFRKLLKFSVPVLVQTLAVGSFYLTDLILVKHFFSATEAGVYAALSILSRIIFFGTVPIAMVSFPLFSRRYAKNLKV